MTGASPATWRNAVGTIILPLGISFYTFLSISYTLDVYRREFEPVRDFELYLTYVMFWPHMIAGPILRAHELIPQLAATTRLTSDAAAQACRLILFGLFLKVGLADQLAPAVDEAFAMKPQQLGGIDVWTMAFAFGFQIYFDFAGYSMIAIGSAKLLGITFPDNFNWPYLATSPREFWRRWHITLSSWIRDYLYLPLAKVKIRGGSAGGIDIQFDAVKASVGVTGSLFLTWLIMGLWHGAAWTFALWGMWHAVFIFAYRLTSHLFDWLPDRAARIGGWGTTLAVVMLGWLPFRAPSLEATFALYARLLDLRSYRGLALRESFYLNVALLLLGMLALYWMTTTRNAVTENRWVRASADIGSLAVAVFVVFIFLRPISQFIYFQF